MNRRYYPEITIRNGFTTFAELMREGSFLLIDKESMESNPDTDLPYELGEYPKTETSPKNQGI